MDWHSSVSNFLVANKYNDLPEFFPSSDFQALSGLQVVLVRGDIIIYICVCVEKFCASNADFVKAFLISI